MGHKIFRRCIYRWQMALRLVLLLCVLLGTWIPACGMDSEPHAAVIAHIQEVAMLHIANLKNFICTQLVTRSADASGSGQKWKPLEVQEIELNYASNKAHYVLRKVNGEAVNIQHVKDRHPFTGYGSEFNFIFRAIFSPQVHAEFTWDHEDTIEGNRICVIQYSVPETTSIFTYSTESQTKNMALHGLIYANCESGEITRLQMKAGPVSITQTMTYGLIKHRTEVPASSEYDIRYRPTTIGPGEFILPESSTVLMSHGGSLTKSESKFLNYHKFTVETKIVSTEDETIP